MVRLLVLLVLLLPAPALAMRGPRLDVRVQSLPGTLRSGETVVLSWDALPDDVEQIELLLSLDDGRRFTTRISPELDGRTTTWRWCVPAIDAARARLVIRAWGTRGERHGVPSVAFRIEPGEADAPEEAFLWMSFSDRDGGDRAGNAMASGTHLGTRIEHPALSSAPFAPLVHRDRVERWEPPDSAVPPESPPPTLFSPSRHLPLRN